MAFDGICGTCGLPFRKYRANSKYCSKLCREMAYKRQYKYKAKESFIKECEACGEPFVTNDKKRRYCKDDKCKAFKQYVKKEPDKRICAWCGKEFSTSHQHQKYCSRDCYLEAAEKRRMDRYGA